MATERQPADPLAPARAWFASRGWAPFPFQVQLWNSYLAGDSGLLHAPTGMGKTLAVALGPMLEAIAERSLHPRNSGLRILWLTPLRALANDTAHALQQACDGLGLKWSVELRTGDTSAARKKKQRERLPQVLVTTPESLSVLLSYPEFNTPGGTLAVCRAVVVDEWHELLSTKRGVQTELGLARLRTLNPSLRTWGLSATLGNLDEAMHTLLGPGASGTLIRGEGRRAYDFRTIIPPDIERFPWAGHLGIRLVPGVIGAIESARSSLLFTNTRSQSEIWFAQLLKTRPDWIGAIALHHGSLDRKLRARVEGAIADGTLRCCVCTSSLDLGVDFAPVDQVIQVGSPKGLARFLQRAGRSGHQPGGVSKIVCVPTNALELVEFAAVRDALTGEQQHHHAPGHCEQSGVAGFQPAATSPSGSVDPPRFDNTKKRARTPAPPADARPIAVEPRPPLTLALDVLVQHMLTLALGGGFSPDALLAEVRRTNAYAELSDEQWRWALDYVQRGGPALSTYPRFSRVEPDALGVYRVTNARLARDHRLNIGTIAADQHISVRFATGKVLGSVEEGFIARMKPGDHFTFSGRVLRLVRVREGSAVVKLGTRKSGVVPSWSGSRMPMSKHLADAVRERLADADRGDINGLEMHAVAPILSLQRRWSALPTPGVTLIEIGQTREGKHAFVYPLEGRLAHEGLAALVAWRMAQREPRSCSIAANDFGFHVQSTLEAPDDEPAWRELLSPANLLADVLACLNAASLARRQFREIARVAGLISGGFPGERRARDIQASAELYYDVLSEFDPGNLLIEQSRREVLEKQLEYSRLASALDRIARGTLCIRRVDHLTPFAFPLWADSLRNELSTEKWTDRVQRMLRSLEDAAGQSETMHPTRSPRARKNRSAVVGANAPP